jgi:hypothetical protein
MIVKEPKKWLLLGALVLLFPVFSVAKPDTGCGVREKCRQVPEGGSALNYLLAVGATCLGAMAVRSRFDKSETS